MVVPPVGEVETRGRRRTETTNRWNGELCVERRDRERKKYREKKVAKRGERNKREQRKHRRGLRIPLTRYSLFYRHSSQNYNGTRMEHVAGLLEGKV